MAGIPVLADRLMRIQASIIIVKCLPEIVRKIKEKLLSNDEKLSKMPKYLTSIADAMTVFINIFGSARESLRKILLQGEFDEYPDAAEMRSTTRLVAMLNKFSQELQPAKSSDDKFENFLIDEMKILEESRSVGLPNFILKFAFGTLLAKMVKEITAMPFDCAEKIWSHMEIVGPS